MNELTAFQRDCLYVIAGLDQPHGLAVKGELTQYYEEKIYRGRLYPNLDTLADEGLVEKQKRDERTNIYSLTEYGRQKITARTNWEDQYINSI